MSKKKRQVPKSGFRMTGPRLNTRSLLRQLTDEQRARDIEQRALVEKLRSEGATWNEIAKLTGMNSRQAARYRFTRDHPPKDEQPKPS